MKNFNTKSEGMANYAIEAKVEDNLLIFIFVLKCLIISHLQNLWFLVIN